MHPTNIFFLRCSNSDRLKAEGLRECPPIVLPRNSSLGHYNLHTYRPEPEKDLESLWPFRFACTHCERAFDYPIEEIRSLAEEESEKVVKWSGSKRFWQLEIVTESKPRKYPRAYVYSITAKDHPTALVKQDVLRIDPPMSTYLGLEITPFDYDFLD